MKSAIIHIKKYYEVKYWAVVMGFMGGKESYFNYDTIFFNSAKEAESEARSFCKWKNLKIRKIKKDY